jgi:hypothetical protein
MATTTIEDHMSDINDSYETDEQDTQGPDIRSLRKRAEQARELEAEVAQLRRENLFARAGIDTDSKVGKMLFRTWEGNNLDELRSEAEELGLLGRPDQGRQAPPIEEQSQQNFRRDLSTGDAFAAAEVESVDPIDDAYENFYVDRKRGVPLEEAQLAAIDRVLVAASNGDQRVIFNQNDWGQRARLSSR